jgi:hypothetical protein
MRAESPTVGDGAPSPTWPVIRRLLNFGNDQLTQPNTVEERRTEPKGWPWGSSRGFVMTPSERWCRFRLIYLWCVAVGKFAHHCDRVGTISFHAKTLKSGRLQNPGIFMGTVTDKPSLEKTLRENALE